MSTSVMSYREYVNDAKMLSFAVLEDSVVVSPCQDNVIRAWKINSSELMAEFDAGEIVESWDACWPLDTSSFSNDNNSNYIDNDNENDSSKFSSSGRGDQNASSGEVGPGFWFAGRKPVLFSPMGSLFED